MPCGHDVLRLSIFDISMCQCINMYGLVESVPRIEFYMGVERNNFVYGEYAVIMIIFG